MKKILSIDKIKPFTFTIFFKILTAGVIYSKVLSVCSKPLEPFPEMYMFITHRNITDPINPTKPQIPSLNSYFVTSELSTHNGTKFSLYSTSSYSPSSYSDQKITGKCVLIAT